MCVLTLTGTMTFARNREWLPNMHNMTIWMTDQVMVGYLLFLLAMVDLGI